MAQVNIHGKMLECSPRVRHRGCMELENVNPLCLYYLIQNVPCPNFEQLTIRTARTQTRHLALPKLCSSLLANCG